MRGVVQPVEGLAGSPWQVGRALCPVLLLIKGGAGSLAHGREEGGNYTWELVTPRLSPSGRLCSKGESPRGTLCADCGVREKASRALRSPRVDYPDCLLPGSRGLTSPALL